jgi:hypothetical protein
LKPAKTVVENAQQFIDIYRYPPTRPEPLYPQPTPDKTAAKCRKDVCQLPDCSCGGKDIPGNVSILLSTNSQFPFEFYCRIRLNFYFLTETETEHPKVS